MSDECILIKFIVFVSCVCVTVVIWVISCLSKSTYNCLWRKRITMCISDTLLTHFQYLDEMHLKPLPIALWSFYFTLTLDDLRPAALKSLRPVSLWDQQLEVMLSPPASSGLETHESRHFLLARIQLLYSDWRIYAGWVSVTLKWK